MAMKKMTLRTAAAVTGGEYVGDGAHLDDVIKSVSRDNREITEGGLFVCIQGARADGHSFANKAFESGAVCCLAEKELEAPTGPYILVKSTAEALRALAKYYRSLFSIPVIGVTGSVGKTTAKEMTAAVLSAKYNTYRTPKNLNNDIGVPLSLLQMQEETEAAVIEMGISDFGEMSVLADMVRPDICITTTIGYCHLDNLHDLDGVLKAKSEVYKYMPSNGVTIVNGDDEKLAGADTGHRKITFGYGEGNEYRAENVENTAFDGVSCRIVSENTDLHVTIPSYGSHLVLAALPAAAVGRLMGLTDGEIAAGMKKFETTEGRANLIKTGYITIVDDCYNANPHSMTASLLSLQTLPGRHVAILGDMKELGIHSNDLHREIGVFAAKSGVDSLICCGNSAEFIYKGLISTGSEKEAWFFPMKDALLSVMPSLIHEGDSVLVKASHSMHFEELTDYLKELK